MSTENFDCGHEFIKQTCGACITKFHIAEREKWESKNQKLVEALRKEHKTYIKGHSPICDICKLLREVGE